MNGICRCSKECGLPADGPARTDFVVALAGNPNVGKSTVFNALTGLRQHTGNWPGKTVARAEGTFEFGGHRFRLVDLPGTYSLLARSADEEVARDFLLFGKPDVTLVVVDATRLERNLNLVLQVLEITERVVVCVNLMDEARRLGFRVDVSALARELGVPVVGTAARQREGMQELLDAIDHVATGRIACRPYRSPAGGSASQRALHQMASALAEAMPALPNPRWVALRLLDGDDRVIRALRNGELGPVHADELLAKAEELRWSVGQEFHDRIVETIYADAARIARAAVSAAERPRRFAWERRLDQIATSRLWGFPMMGLLFAAVFWITITGANYPSRLLHEILVGRLYPLLQSAAVHAGAPAWLKGLLVDGMYLATAWVVSVMLPPMAIFFPLFTLLEDLGYLPRVAFNLDWLFKRACAHGKQALTMMMGYGCNAAGVVATRIIDSPRERLIAILTNNFSLCNGRWPTQFLLASLFIGVLAPPALAGMLSAAAVMAVTLLGVLFMFVVSWGLSRTVLRGEVSTFSLELPPYRPPRLWQTIYTSLIDRTLIVLWRAVVFAAPAGCVIWLVSNVRAGGMTVAEHAVRWLDPLGWCMGLNGVILLAYVIAIPANEIVIPTVLMLTVLTTGSSGVGAGAGVLFEMEAADVKSLLSQAGWTTLTAVNLMLFSLLHNPCSTTLYTIYKETRSAKWTAVAALLPVAIGIGVTSVVALIVRAVS
ncbi:MAG: ferrous iron transport protein B [Verrucomicrobiae bacterium]|nr:ferrous iron transport protein B [Verrucomicrobiae bacterium]